MALAGVAEFPARVKCASLCWHTLNAALAREPHRCPRSNRCALQRTNRSSSSAMWRPSWCLPGQAITLKLGLAGYITQALGGSFTLYIEGNLYRLSGDQADAIGKEVVRLPELPPNATEDDVRELAWEQMRSCLTRRFRSTSSIWAWCTNAK
jgi:hypothetical protein